SSSSLSTIFTTVRVSFNLAIATLASLPVAPKSFCSALCISGASGLLMTMEKFLPSGQAFVVPLQNFAISARVTSFTLLLAEVTIAIFLNAASAETAHAAITQPIASVRYSFAEVLSCMDHFSFQKEYRKYSFLC